MNCQFLVEVGPDLLDSIEIHCRFHGAHLNCSLVFFFKFKVCICVKSTVSLLDYPIVMEDEPGFIFVFPAPSLGQQRWHSESLLNICLQFCLNFFFCLILGVLTALAVLCPLFWSVCIHHSLLNPWQTYHDI